MFSFGLALARMTGGNGQDGEKEDSLFTNDLQIRNYLIISLANFILLGVGLEFLYSF